MRIDAGEQVRIPRARERTTNEPTNEQRRMSDLEAYQASARSWIAEHRRYAPADYGAICPPDLVDHAVDLAAPDPRRRVRRHPLARDPRRTGAHDRPHRGVAVRVRLGGRAVGVQHGRPRARRGRDPALRYARATGGPSASDALRRSAVVPAVLRARCRQRPRLAHDACRPRWRPLRRQRPEGVVLGRSVQRLGHPHGPNRTRARASTTASASSCSRWTCRASRSARCAR